MKRIQIQVDLKSLEGVIFRQNHMKENIQKLEYGKYFSNRANNNQNFKHTIEVKLTVNTKKLWENARSGEVLETRSEKSKMEQN